MTKEKMTLEELTTAIEGNIIAYNTAMLEERLKDAQKLDAELIELEAEYIAQRQIEVFKELAETEKPMLQAVTIHHFNVFGHVDKVDKKEGTTTREMITRKRQIDLKRFDEFCRRSGDSPAHDPMWYAYVERFNQLMCMRAATELGLDPKVVADSYYVSKQAEELALGKTPTSNTKILAALQKCVDTIIYKDEKGEGKNEFKAVSHDVAYLLMVYAKKSKNELTVATANHSVMRRLIADICNRIVTGNTYTVDYKTKK